MCLSVCNRQETGAANLSKNENGRAIEAPNFPSNENKDVIDKKKSMNVFDIVQSNVRLLTSKAKP